MWTLTRLLASCTWAEYLDLDGDGYGSEVTRSFFAVGAVEDPNVGDRAGAFYLFYGSGW